MTNAQQIADKLKIIVDKNPHNKTLMDLHTRYTKSIQILDGYLHPKHTEASLKRLSKDKRRKLLMEHEQGAKEALRAFKIVSKEVQDFFDAVSPERKPEFFQ